MTQIEIATEMGISRSLVAKVIAAHLRVYSRSILDKIDTMRAIELSRYESTEAELMAQYAEYMAVGGRDPHDRFAAATKYAETLLKIIDAKRKLMGLDYTPPVAKTDGQSLEDILMALPPPVLKGDDDEPRDP
jgi:hypothetical protein